MGDKLIALRGVVHNNGGCMPGQREAQSACNSTTFFAEPVSPPYEANAKEFGVKPEEQVGNDANIELEDKYGRLPRCNSLSNSGLKNQ